MDSKYILGCAKVDAHHGILISLLDDLHTKLGTRTVEAEDLTLARNSLKNYAIHHFALEERLMAESRYPGIVEHCDQHTKFLERTTNMHLESDVRSATLDLVVALTSWLTRHIMSEDRKLVDWIKDNRPELL